MSIAKAAPCTGRQVVFNGFGLPFCNPACRTILFVVHQIKPMGRIRVFVRLIGGNKHGGTRSNCL